MNLLTKYTKLFFASSLLFLAACEDPGKVGFEIQPQEDLLGVAYTDTFSINTELVRISPIITSNTGNILAGTIENPETGKVSAKGYFQIVPPTNDSIRIPAGSQFLSMTIDLNILSVYGNKGSDQSFDIYKVTETIKQDENYNSSSSFPYESSPLTTGTFNFVNQKTKDTTATFQANSLGQEIFDLAVAKKIGGYQSFLELFKGFVITGSASSPNSAIYTINAAPLSQTNIKQSVATLKYRNPNATGADSVTTVTLPIAGNSNAVAFTNITTELTGNLAALQNGNGPIPTSQAGNKAYVQGLTGIRTKVTIPGLENMKETGGFANLAIAKALLVISVDSIANYPPANSIRLTRLDKEDNIRYELANGKETTEELPIYNSSITNYNSKSFFYDATTKSFTIDITEYINTVVNKKPDLYTGLATENNSFLITSASNDRSVNQLVFSDASASHTKPFKLRIYYVPLNK